MRDGCCDVPAKYVSTFPRFFEMNAKIHLRPVLAMMNWHFKGSTAQLLGGSFKIKEN